MDLLNCAWTVLMLPEIFNFWSFVSATRGSTLSRVYERNEFNYMSHFVTDELSVTNLDHICLYWLCLLGLLRFLFSIIIISQDEKKSKDVHPLQYRVYDVERHSVKVADKFQMKERICPCVMCDVFPVTCDNTGLCGRERRCLSDTRHHHNGAVHSVPDHNITKYFASSHRKIWKYYRLTPAVLVTRHTGSISRGHQIPSAPPARLSSPLFGDYSLMFRWAFNSLQVWHSLEANNITRFPYQLKP